MHGASAEQVQVEVVDGLAAIGSDVDDNAVAVAEVLSARQLIGDAVEVADEGLFVFAGPDLSERGDVLPGNDERMYGSLGIDV